MALVLTEPFGGRCEAWHQIAAKKSLFCSRRRDAFSLQCLMFEKCFAKCACISSNTVPHKEFLAIRTGIARASATSALRRLRRSTRIETQRTRKRSWQVGVCA